MAGHRPSGTVTFLLTDLEGSTRLWERDPEQMKAAMARHDEILEKTITAYRGFVFARMGDGMAAAFATASDAVSAAAAIQRAIADEPCGTASPLRARIGLHTDEGTIVEGGGYANQPINRCSRLMAAAHGGQAHRMTTRRHGSSYAKRADFNVFGYERLDRTRRLPRLRCEACRNRLLTRQFLYRAQVTHRLTR